MDKKEYQHQWYLKNREKVIERAKKRYRENKGEIRKYKKEWIKNRRKTDLSFKKKCYEYTKQWRKRNIEYVRAYERKYRKEYNKLPHVRERERTRLYDRRHMRKEECRNCNSIKNLELHHFDYTQRLTAIVLCRKCHNKLTFNNE